MNYEYTGKPLWYHDPIIGMLPYVAKLLEEHNIKYWLDWGTLLGAVRNGRMIPWDYDIDLGMFHDDAQRLIALSPDIAKDGFDLTAFWCNTYVHIIRFFTKEHGLNFHIDIYPWIVVGETVRAVDNLNRIRTMIELTDLDSVEFEGAKYPCPQNPEKSLLHRYGTDWRIPKVLSGNVIYINRFDPSNLEILAEIKKHPDCNE